MSSIEDEAPSWLIWSDFAITAVGAVGAWGLYKRMELDAGAAASLATLAIAFAIALTRLVARQPLLRVIYAAIRIALVALPVILVGVAVLVLRHLGQAVPVHAGHATRVQVAQWVAELRTGIWALAVLAGLALSFAAWKFLSMRFVESRIGVIKDTLRSSEAFVATAEDDRAIDKALSGLESILTLSPWDQGARWLSWIPRLGRGPAPRVRLEFLVPNESEGQFVIEASYVGGGTLPHGAREASEWLAQKYRPRFLNEDRFNRLARDAREAHGRRWQRFFCAYPEHQEVTSAAGWIAAKREVWFCRDALSCIGFDRSPERRLRTEGGFDPRDSRWVRVRSFIACPVETSNGGHRLPAVLFVSKNVRFGFVREDVESVLLVAEIVKRIYREKLKGEHDGMASASG